MIQDLIVTAVTPHDVLDEDMMSDRGAPAKDRWPRGDDGSDDSPSSGRYALLLLVVVVVAVLPPSCRLLNNCPTSVK